VAYRTINLRPETFARLRLYQTGGKSMSDVVDSLMDSIEPEAVHERELRIARKRLKEMRERGTGMSLDELERDLDRRRKARG